MSGKQWLAMVLVGCAMILSLPHANAERGTTRIEGPGFQYSNKKGWFGRSEQTYTDVLGNTHTRKTNWLGIPKQESTLFGNRITQNGQDVSVTTSDGQPVVTRKHSWFGGTETKVDGNSILDSLLHPQP